MNLERTLHREFVDGDRQLQQPTLRTSEGLSSHDHFTGGE